VERGGIVNIEQTERLIAALERLASAVERQGLPTPAEIEDAQFRRSVAVLKAQRAKEAAWFARVPSRTNAIAGPATGRGLVK
jgi:hypothetical protein